MRHIYYFLGCALVPTVLLAAVSPLRAQSYGGGQSDGEQPIAASEADSSQKPTRQSTSVEELIPGEQIAELTNDPAFAHWVDIDALQSALRDSDSARVADCALGLAHGERILLRSHRAILAADVLDAAVRLAAAKDDRTSLDRLQRFARAANDSKLASLIVEHERLVATSRASLPTFTIDPATTSEEDYRIGALVIRDLEHAKLDGGQAKTKAIAAFVQETCKAKLLSEAMESRLLGYVKEAEPALPKVGAMDSVGLWTKSLEKLSGDSRIPWGPEPAGFNYYSFNGNKVRLIANLYAVAFDRDSLGRASQSIAASAEREGWKSHTWDDKWYVKSVPDDGSQILFLIAHNTQTGKTTWVAVKNTPSRWIVMKGDGRVEYPGNGEMVKRTVDINGKKIDFDIRNPYNRYDTYYKEWATPNHIWYSFGY